MSIQKTIKQPLARGKRDEGAVACSPNFASLRLCVNTDLSSPRAAVHAKPQRRKVRAAAVNAHPTAGRCMARPTCKSPRVSKGDMHNMDSVGRCWPIADVEHIAIAYARALCRGFLQFVSCRRQRKQRDPGASPGFVKTNRARGCERQRI